MKKSSPVRLEKKEEKHFNVTPQMILFLFFILVFLFSIVLAIGCASPYNMNWA